MVGPDTVSVAMRSHDMAMIDDDDAMCLVT